VQHFIRNAVAIADQIALVTLDELADSAELDKLALATNFEDEPYGWSTRDRWPS
jgi:hypothetical protein